MNVLLISEYRKSSANYNIVQKIVTEFQSIGVNTSIYYLINDKISYNSEINDLLLNNSIQSSGSHMFLSYENDDEWVSKSSFKKFIYLLTHLKLFYSYFKYKIDKINNYSNGRRKIEKACSDNNIDLIIGFSAPHIIEKIVAKIKNTSNVPIYIFRLDPYAFNPCLPKSDFNRRLKFERFLLSRIDKMFTTSLIIRDLLDDHIISAYSEKLITVEFPLISLSDQAETSAKSNKHLFQKKAGCIYLLHAGMFYEDIRNPNKLVKFIKALPENYNLLVAGYNSYLIREYDFEIRDRVIDLGCLSREDLKSVVADCDFLVSYNNLNTNMIPSKLFECIDSGKPFINLCHTDKCPTIEYIKDYDMAYTVIVDRPLPKNELISFLEKTKGCKCSRDIILSRFGKCTVKYVAKQILNCVN